MPRNAGMLDRFDLGTEEQMIGLTPEWVIDMPRNIQVLAGYKVAASHATSFLSEGKIGRGGEDRECARFQNTVSLPAESGWCNAALAVSDALPDEFVHINTRFDIH